MPLQVHTHEAAGDRLVPHQHMGGFLRWSLPQGSHCIPTWKSLEAGVLPCDCFQLSGNQSALPALDLCYCWSYSSKSNAQTLVFGGQLFCPWQKVEMPFGILPHNGYTNGSKTSTHFYTLPPVFPWNEVSYFSFMSVLFVQFNFILSVK